jgi:hypothetical protein
MAEHRKFPERFDLAAGTIACARRGSGRCLASSLGAEAGIKNVAGLMGL